jgi:hypothetical protein
MGEPAARRALAALVLMHFRRRSLPRVLTPSLLCLAACAATASPADPAPERRAYPERREAALEFNWTPLDMPAGERTALLGGTYMVAVNPDWGFGPSVYAGAQGDHGGLFTVGVTAQRRWRLFSSPWFVAAGLYAGAGGATHSKDADAGGGLMLRPELSLRRAFGPVYAGLGVAHVTFPSGNIRDTQWTVVIGRSDNFLSFLPTHSGMPGRADGRLGLKFDEISLSAGTETFREGSRRRNGAPLTGRLDKAGADLRRYVAPGRWWGIEASGAAGGDVNGYMELLANAGADCGIFGEQLRVGAQLSAGLGGGGVIDTGSGWLLRAGPTLRWITPWGPTLRADASYLTAPGGHYRSEQLRLSLSLPLESAARARAPHSFLDGTVREMAWYVTTPHFQKLRFEDGTEDAVTGLGLTFNRDLDRTWYGTAQAGSAAWGEAGGFSYGLVGLGAKTRRMNGVRLGIEGLAGAAGGGGVDVRGGAVAGGEVWAQWEGIVRKDRLRLKAGIGHLQALGNGGRGTPVASLSLGWAFGTLAP